jgi:hypothetical protein
LRFGVDPYHLGIVFLLNLEIGYMTPPVGLNLFISSFRFNKPITQLYRSVLPFIGLLGIALILVTYVPILSTWLPSLVESNAVSLDSPDMDDDDYEEGLDLDSLEGDDFDLDSLEGGGDELDLDALEGDGDELDLEALEGEGLDLDSLEDNEELDLDAIEAAEEEPTP